MPETVRPAGAAASRAWLVSLLSAMGRAALALSNRLERGGARPVAGAPDSQHSRAWRSSGPPAHWLKLVNEHAPALLQTAPEAAQWAGVAIEVPPASVLRSAPAAASAQAPIRRLQRRPGKETAPKTAPAEQDARLTEPVRASPLEPASMSLLTLPGHASAARASPRPIRRSSGQATSAAETPAMLAALPFPPVPWPTSALRFRCAPSRIDSSAAPARAITTTIPAAGAPSLAYPTVRMAPPPRTQAWEAPRAPGRELPMHQPAAAPRWPELPSPPLGHTAQDTGPWPALPDAWGTEIEHGPSASAPRTTGSPWSE